MKNIKIGTKLLVGFVLVALIAGVVGLIGYNSVEELGEVRMPSVRGLSEIQDGAMKVWVGERGLINRRMSSGEVRQAQFGYIEDAWKMIDEGLKRYEPLPQSKEEAALWKDYVPKFEGWKKSVGELVSLSKDRDRLMSSGLNQEDEKVAALDGKIFDLSMHNRQLKLVADEVLNKVVTLNHEIGEASAKSGEVNMMIAVGIAMLAAFIIGLFITRSITVPVLGITDKAKALALGDIDQEIDIDQKDEIGILADAFKGMIAAQKDKAHVAEQIAEGNLAVKMEILSPKDTLGKSMDTMKKAIQNLATDAGMLVKAAVDGKLATRADASKHEGDFRKIVQGVNDTLDAVIGPLNVAANYVDRISKGDIPVKITDNYNGDFNAIKSNLNTCIDAVNLLVKDADILARAAMDGKLATRADAAKHQGDFQKIVQGVNGTLDAVIGPLNVAANYVDRISKGDIPSRITDSYNGDFNSIKNNLNQCISAVGLLVNDANTLAQAAVEGKLGTRADASKHQGDFQKIVSGVNMTLDAVLDPINEAAKVLEQLADYNLTSRVVGNYKGEHAKIKESLNATATALHDSMSQVAEAADQVSSASTQIASSSQQVAEGTSEQASALEETSSALEEMAGMTKQNADNTLQAKGLAESTRAAAVKGASAMTNMLSSMDKIKSAAEGTAAIIKDINDIAFQTNLLALNAAVEAARAGDAGRGFAVVAEEVRNLAGRAKEAAKNTEDLIKESVRLAVEGQTISGQVNENLSEIVGSVGKVTDIVAEIAVASQEQARGIEQVNKAITEMDKVVQQSAANSEESSSAAEELAGQSEEMAAMVGKFKLNRAASAKRPQATQMKKPQTKKPVAKSNGKTNGHANDFHLSPEHIIPLESDPDFAEF